MCNYYKEGMSREATKNRKEDSGIQSRPRRNKERQDSDYNKFSVQQKTIFCDFVLLILYFTK